MKNYYQNNITIDPINDILKFSNNYTKNISEWEKNNSKGVAITNTPGKHLSLKDKMEKNQKERYIKAHITQKVAKSMHLYTTNNKLNYEDFNTLYNLWLEYYMPIIKPEYY